MNSIHDRELVVTGASGLSHRDHDRACDMVDTGQLNLKPMITRRHGRREYARALFARGGTTGKRGRRAP